MNLPIKIDELKQIEGVFSRNQLNDLVIDKLKEIMQLKNNIKLDNLGYTTKRGKIYSFSKYTLPIVFLRDIHEGNLSLEDANKEQTQLGDELKDMSKGKIPIEKIWPSGLGNNFVCKRVAVQTLLWSLEFMIQINLEHNTIAV